MCNSGVLLYSIIFSYTQGFNHNTHIVFIYLNCLVGIERQIFFFLNIFARTFFLLFIHYFFIYTSFIMRFNIFYESVSRISKNTLLPSVGWDPSNSHCVLCMHGQQREGRLNPQQQWAELKAWILSS